VRDGAPAPARAVSHIIGGASSDGVMRRQHIGAVRTGEQIYRDLRGLPRRRRQGRAADHCGVRGPSPQRGPFRIDAELWYQPIGFRWARNLRLQPAAETDRFVAYYESMADVSGIVLARESVNVR
jgi:hypothetical protein